MLDSVSLDHLRMFIAAAMKEAFRQVDAGCAKKNSQRRRWDVQPAQSPDLGATFLWDDGLTRVRLLLIRCEVGVSAL